MKKLTAALATDVVAFAPMMVVGRCCVTRCDGDADVDFGGLAAWVPHQDTLAERLETSHPDLDTAPASS